MAKTAVIARELKKMQTVAKYAKVRAKLKTIINDQKATEEERWEARLKLQQLPRNASPTRVRHRCRITGRPRGTYKKFGLGRNKLREYVMKGDVPGVVKASW